MTIQSVTIVFSSEVGSGTLENCLEQLLLRLNLEMPVGDES